MKRTRRWFLGLAGFTGEAFLPRRVAAQAPAPLAQPETPGPRAFAARALALRDAAVAAYAGPAGQPAAIVSVATSSSTKTTTA